MISEQIFYFMFFVTVSMLLYFFYYIFVKPYNTKLNKSNDFLVGQAWLNTHGILTKMGISSEELGLILSSDDKVTLHGATYKITEKYYYNNVLEVYLEIDEKS